MSVSVPPCTQRLNWTAPVPVVVDGFEPLLVPDPVDEAPVDEPEPAAPAVPEEPEALPPAADDPPAELDELDLAGAGGPRLERMSLSIRASSVRASRLCSTSSRPICAWRS